MSSLIFADKEMISKMLERLEKLLNGVAVQRALSVQSIDHSEIVRLAELRVVRECNLPDSYTTFLDVSLLKIKIYNRIKNYRIYKYTNRYCFKHSCIPFNLQHNKASTREYSNANYIISENEK